MWLVHYLLCPNAANILKPRAAYRTYMLVETSIEWMEWDF